MKYSDYFDKDGIVIKSYEVDSAKMSLKWKNRFVRREEKKRYKAYRKAVKLKLSELDAMLITSGDKQKEDKYALPESEKEFLGRNTLKDVFMKLFPAVLFGLYGVKEIADLSWANFAWTLFQALTGFASAVPQMFSAQSYVINDVRTGTVKKIGWIDDFSADRKRNAAKEKAVEQASMKDLSQTLKEIETQANYIEVLNKIDLLSKEDRLLLEQKIVGIDSKFCPIITIEYSI